MPDLARVTSAIAKNPDLRKRKLHERALREKSEQTKSNYATCGPPVAQSALQPSSLERDQSGAHRVDGKFVDGDSGSGELSALAADCDAAAVLVAFNPAQYRGIIYDRIHDRLGALGFPGIITGPSQIK